MLEYSYALSTNQHLLVSGHMVKKELFITFPDVRSVFFSFFNSRKRKIPPLRQQRGICFRVIITSQWIFVAPCSHADGSAIELDRQQMFSEPSNSLCYLRFQTSMIFHQMVHRECTVCLYYLYLFIFTNCPFNQLAQRNPAVRWQEGGRRGKPWCQIWISRRQWFNWDFCALNLKWWD